jgi:hypothetical protein
MYVNLKYIKEIPSIFIYVNETRERSFFVAIFEQDFS